MARTVDVAIVVLVLMTFLPLVPTTAWWIRIWSFPRVQVSFALAALLPVARLARDRYRPSGVARPAIIVLALLYQFVVLAPWTPAYARQVPSALACDEPNRLTVFQANVQARAGHSDALLSQVAEIAPDMLVLNEVDGWWRERLRTIAARYPHQLDSTGGTEVGTLLLSAFPMVDPTVLEADDGNALLHAGIEIPAGPVISVYAVHPPPQQINQSSAPRDLMLLRLARQAAAGGGPQVVTGDLNAPPWSGVVRRVADLAALRDPRIGRGWLPTWRAHAFFLRWPLDQVLVSRHFTLLDLRVLPPFGSDHQALITSVCLSRFQTVQTQDRK